MMVPMMLLLAQPMATPPVPELPVLPRIAVCPTEPTDIPPFGYGCDAKEQAERVSSIMREQSRSETLEVKRYRMIGDGRTIAEENGTIVGIASSCLLPTENKSGEHLAGKTEPSPDAKPQHDFKRDASSQVTKRCETEKFAIQFSSPVTAGR